MRVNPPPDQLNPEAVSLGLLKITGVDLRQVVEQRGFADAPRAYDRDRLRLPGMGCVEGGKNLAQHRQLEQLSNSSIL